MTKLNRKPNFKIPKQYKQTVTITSGWTIHYDSRNLGVIVKLKDWFNI